MTEVRSELASRAPGERYGNLQDIAHSDPIVMNLLAPTLLDELQRHTDIPIVALRRMIEILVKAQLATRPQYIALALERFAQVDDLTIAALYLGAAFSGDPTAATATLTTRLDTMTEAEQTELILHALPGIFGDQSHSSNVDPSQIPFDCLERLVRIAFRTIRPGEDHHHPSGVVHGYDNRDYAAQARGKAFDRFVGTPGRATYDALITLTDSGDISAPASRLRALARERAAEDSEPGQWPAAEACAFEQSHETAPRTAHDLQLVTLRRIADMQHDLLHEDFAQGATLSGLVGERPVQVWVADRFRVKQGRGYSVERDPRAVGEKQPDVRLRATATDASASIEIKVAESWSIPDLEAALNDQLCGRYLRARDARHGILLLVHQRPRAHGWRDPDDDGHFLTFEEVVQRLRRLAAGIAGSGTQAPQPEIAVLDVSSCAAAPDTPVPSPA